GNLVVQGSLLIVTDTAANVARILQLVSVLDVEVATDELRLIPVRFADSTELARILSEFFAGRRVRTPTAAAAAPAPPAGPPRPGAAPVAPGIGGAADSGDRPPLVIADKRTNILVVSGRKSDVELAAKLASQLDVDTQANKRVFVYYVENVKSK